MFHKIIHLLNWFEMKLFANMGVDLTVDICSCTDNIWVLTQSLFGLISLIVTFSWFDF